MVVSEVILLDLKMNSGDRLLSLLLKEEGDEAQAHNARAAEAAGMAEGRRGRGSGRGEARRRLG